MPHRAKKRLHHQTDKSRPPLQPTDRTRHSLQATDRARLYFFLGLLATAILYSYFVLCLLNTSIL